MAATGWADTSCRKRMRRARSSSSRRDVQVRSEPLAVAQMRMRSLEPVCSTCSTWTLGGNTAGQARASASTANTASGAAEVWISCSVC
ncbi:hypothetical protein SVIOM74S_05894 [Streptomyces violarus]